MKPAIKLLHCQCMCDREYIIDAVSELWQICFEDSAEYIQQFCRKMPLHGAVIALDTGKTVGMALLLRPDFRKRAYYGYSVCTHPDYRGHGICQKIHEEIHGICKREHAGYFVRPAKADLAGFYRKLGLDTLLWETAMEVTGENTAAWTQLAPDAYVHIRKRYFAPAGLCAWDEGAVNFMCCWGYRAIGFSLNGTECAAFLLEEEKLICEVCAPKYLLDRAASCAAAALGGHAVVRRPESAHGGCSAVMGFGIERDFYFNLYFE